MTDKKGSGIADLVELMARLRGEPGCPWDREQTPRTLTPYIIEEAHELVEAIQQDDPTHVCEELGDLLFQIVFQARIAEEQGHFNLEDVIAAIAEKMTRRHPHVFGDLTVNSSAEVRKNWARIKEEEGRKTEIKKSALGETARSLPALLRARRLTVDAAEVGFDWPRWVEVGKKLDEEWAELKQSIADGDRDRIEDEFGDLLFVMVNLSRFLQLDPEAALHRAAEKFIHRFQAIEQKAVDQGRALEQMTLAEMDILWDEVKAEGRRSIK